MTLTKVVVFLAAVADFVFCGLLSNGFIAAVLTTEWAKSRSLPACEQFLLSLGISNICCTFGLIMDITFSNVTLAFSKVLILYSSLNFWVMFLRYWLTAWLCAFYCIKILNITYSFFLWWKMRISRLVPWLIVGSSVISFFVSFFTVLSFYLQFQSNGTANITNITKDERIEEIWNIYMGFIFVSTSFCPLLIAFLCSILVVTYLRRHISKMAGRGSNVRNTQTEAHFKAARTVVSILFLYISYCVIQIVLLSLLFQKDALSILIFSIMKLMYSPVQGAILVLSNPKLKQTATWMLAKSQC